MADETVTIDHSPLIGPLSRMGERVAALEAKHDAMKGDTEVIRRSVHDMNQEIQKVVLTEHQCLMRLENLTTLVEKLAIFAQPKAWHEIARQWLPWFVAMAGLVAWAWEHVKLAH